VWWHSDAYAPAGSVSLGINRMQDAVIDEALDTIRASDDPDERRRAAEALNRRFGEQVYDLWIGWTVWSIGHAPDVHGIVGATLPDGGASAISGGGVHQVAQIWVGPGRP
jgi:peptide/nickel transport system substrate-binding protein